MQLLIRVLDTVRTLVRAGAKKLASVLNRATAGKLTPDTVTAISLLGHLPVAFLIATLHPIWAAGFLVIFGLMDTLDGELARLQNRATVGGMLLDASTDRMKESLVYIAIAFAFVSLDKPYLSVVAVAAATGALLVSYVKAKGETAVASTKQHHANTNKLFADGLMRYEVRMGVIVIGLLSGYLGLATALVAILAWGTAAGRLIRIMRWLKHVQD